MANYDQCASLSWSQVSQKHVMASDVATDQCQKEICSWRHQCFYQRHENDSSPMETNNSSSAPSLSSAAVSLWTMSHLASEESHRFAWPTFGHGQTENNRVDYCQWSVDRTQDDDPSAYDDQRHFGGCDDVVAAGKFNFYGTSSPCPLSSCSVLWASNSFQSRTAKAGRVGNRLENHIKFVEFLFCVRENAFTSQVPFLEKMLQQRSLLLPPLSCYFASFLGV